MRAGENAGTFDIQSRVAPAVTLAALPTDATAPKFAELFEQHIEFVWRVVAARGVAPDDVQDVTQEVFLVALRRLSTWHPGLSSATTWLFGIAVKVLANYRRKARGSVEDLVEPEEHEARAATPDPVERVDHARLLRKLDAALEVMEPARAEVFILFEIAELPMIEVAEAVGCPVKTAYKRLYAARDELATKLEEHRSFP
jgi:RNA polymerase sigma-70 factor (ECF subfamily)